MNESGSQQANQLNTQFLRRSPYCVSTNPLPSPDEVPANSSDETGASESNVLYFYHCSRNGDAPPNDNSIAYLMTHAVLNDFLNNERGGHPIVWSIFSGNYGYMNDYTGTNSDYGWWWTVNASTNKGCLNPPGYDGVYTYEQAFTDDIEEAPIGEEPNFEHRVEWLYDLLRCQENYGLAIISAPYSRFMGEIRQAIHDFATDLTYDPLSGVTRVLHANIPNPTTDDPENVDAIVTPVGGTDDNGAFCRSLVGGNPVDQNAVESAYDGDVLYYCSNPPSSDNNHIEDMQVYRPNYPAILRPSLVLSFVGPNVELGTRTGYSWVSLTFQISENEPDDPTPPAKRPDSKNIPR